MLLRTLGGLALEGSGFSRPKPLLLLAYVALEGPQDRRHLSELFWPGAADPLNSLTVALTQLRSAAPDCIEADRYQVGADLKVDADLLLEALDSGRPEQAMKLYRGPFLQGLPLQNLGVELEEWIYETRERLAVRMQRQICALAEAEAAAGDFHRGARRAEIAIGLPGAPPPDEKELLRLHLLLLAGGSPLERGVRSDLEELGPVTLAGDRDDARRELRRAVQERGAPPRSNLPARRSSFVGREGQLDLVVAALRAPRCRLVTLLGPAGVGKTRLALEVARQEHAERRFPGGVHFVGLAAVRSPDAVVQKIADALGLLGRTTRSLRDEVEGHLAPRRSLLVLDNFERLLEAAGLVADLLEHCSLLSILVTSRVPLRIRGEQELAIRPLALPVVASDDPEVLLRSPAVQLFLDRARAIRSDLQDDPAVLQAVSQICRRLDGLPLALELAAARIRMFPPSVLANRLGRRLDMLEGGRRDLPERHRTLRSAIAWGHDLLAPAHRQLFRRLGVFTGSFDATTASRFGAELSVRLDGVEAGPAGALDALEVLVENCLVQTEAAGEAQRFFLLETVREYALERLEEAGESETARRAHAEEYLALAQENVGDATGPSQVRWLQDLRAERENLEAALEWAESHGDVAIALGIANAVWRVWLVSDPLEVGAGRFERLLRLAGAEDDDHERSVALGVLGTLSNQLGRLDSAGTILGASLAIQRQRGEGVGVATVLNNLSWTHLLRGEASATRRLSGEAARIFRGAGDVRGMAVARNNLGWLAQLQGRFELAARHHREGLDLRIRAGDRRGEAYARVNLAWADHSLGLAQQAERLAADGLSILEELEDDQLIAWALQVLALLALGKGEVARALDLLRRSVSLWRWVGNRVALAIALSLEGRALVSCQREPDALASLEEAVAIGEATGSPWPLVDALPFLANLTTGGADSSEGRKHLQRASQIAAGLGAIPTLQEVCRTAGVPVPPTSDSAAHVESEVLEPLESSVFSGLSGRTTKPKQEW